MLKNKLILHFENLKVVLKQHSRIFRWLSSANVDSCNVFIADVLLHDFPAEVFLQRPQVIKVHFKIYKRTVNKLSRYILKMINVQLINYQGTLCKLSRQNLHSKVEY